MRLYRECWGAGDVSLDRKDGRWEVLWMGGNGQPH